MAINEEYKNWINKVELLGYAGLLGNEFEYKIHKLSKLIGYKHHLSVGHYKEELLRSYLRNIIPKKFSVGTGFVLFPSTADDSSLGVSHEIDIIIYDDTCSPPIFKDKDFVVLRPEAVLIAIEVKGMISSSDLSKAIGKFNAYSKEWVRTKETYRRVSPWSEIELNTPSLYLFAWDRKPNGGGNEVSYKCSAEKLYENYSQLCAQYGQINNVPKAPYLSNFTCYRDFIVHIDHFSEGKAYNPSYVVTTGKFESLEKEFDRTIYELTQDILYTLEAHNMVYDINRHESDTPAVLYSSKCFK